MIYTEIKFFQITAGYSLFDHKSSEEILEDVKVEQVDKKIRK
jgi:hypothetical protein